MNRLLRCLIYLIPLFAIPATSCRHARIRLIPPLPASCRGSGARNAALCAEQKNDLAMRIEKGEKTREVKRITHWFYFWGFFPRKISVDLTRSCPNGVYEVYQYATVTDGAISEITLGIVSPRTLQITCY